MKPAALPAADAPERTTSITPRHLRLVTVEHPAPPVSERPSPGAEPTSAEDPDEMWDNLPV